MFARPATPCHRHQSYVLVVVAALAVSVAGRAAEGAGNAKSATETAEAETETRAPDAYWLEPEGGWIGVGNLLERPPVDMEATLTIEDESRFWPDGALLIPAPDEEIAADDRYPAILNLGFTAAAVGENIILTAAHNVWDPDGQAVWSPSDLSSRIAASVKCCDVHPDYKTDRSADYALCRLSSLQLPPSCAVENRACYESINRDSQVEAAATSILLSGYGGDCATSIGGPCEDLGPKVITGNLGLKRVPVSRLPAETGSNYLEVEWCICAGDSGGPGFIEVGSKRWIAGVNSKRGDNLAGYKWAMLSSTSTPRASSWFEAWARGAAEGQTCGLAEPVEICGVNVTCNAAE